MGMSNGRLLISYAHPDDESFGLGGMIAAYVARGVEVYLICATNGDVGTVKPELLADYSSVAELRLAELDKAVKLLGISQTFLLGYKDSGMMGSETANDPACLWQAKREDVARRVVEVIREVQPQVVITFNKYGGYGHPDHIAIQRATTDAFTLAGDPDYATGQQPFQPQKLYYSSVPQRQIQFAIWLMRMRGEDPRHMGRNKDVDVQAILEHAEPIHTTVDIAGYLAAWDAASACHASQQGGRITRMPGPIRARLARRQSFTRIFPVPKQNRIDERDLFANVTRVERFDNPIPHAQMVDASLS
jgi:LmbE family N-acetylglucosaminyl deacetylase